MISRSRQGAHRRGDPRRPKRKTSGEIFCVVARICERLPPRAVAWAAVIALLVPLPLIYFTLLAGVGDLSRCSSPSFIAAALVLSLPAIRFRIVPRRRKHDRAHALAMRQFLAQGLHKTESRTGVLIFASLAERYAEIVADAGINAKVDAGGLGRGGGRADRRRSRRGRPGDGFVAAIEQCGAVLARALPARRAQPRRTAEQAGGDLKRV